METKLVTDEALSLRHGFLLFQRLASLLFLSRFLTFGCPHGTLLLLLRLKIFNCLNLFLLSDFYLLLHVLLLAQLH